jgi:hypothetical protein
MRPLGGTSQPYTLEVWNGDAVGVHGMSDEQVRRPAASVTIERFTLAKGDARHHAPVGSSRRRCRSSARRSRSSGAQYGEDNVIELDRVQAKMRYGAAGRR